MGIAASTIVKHTRSAKTASERLGSGISSPYLELVLDVDEPSVEVVPSAELHQSLHEQVHLLAVREHLLALPQARLELRDECS